MKEVTPVAELARAIFSGASDEKIAEIFADWEKRTPYFCTLGGECHHWDKDPYRRKGCIFSHATEENVLNARNKQCPFDIERVVKSLEKRG